MSNIQLKIAGRQYDRVRPLFDGTVKLAGIEANFEVEPRVDVMFEKMIRHQAYDVSELGLTFYLRTLELDNPPFIAIPVFPNRAFRHSAIFINKASGIEKPADLAGKTIGEFGVYGHDAGIWPKGMLADEYGVRPEQSRWLIGASDWYMPPYDFVPRPHPADVDVRPVPVGKALGPMLEAGEIDAFISAVTPKCILEGSPKVGRLFPDSEAAERDYYRRTGIFPIMHTVVIRRDVLAKHPELARTIYNGYSEAKDAAEKEYREGMVGQSTDIMVPWFSELFAKNSQLFPADWWPYGLAANRQTMDTFLRYFHEQGLSKRRFTCEEIFVPELLGT